MKARSRKRLTKRLIIKFSILDGAKYFSSGIFQNYLAFMPAKKYFRYFSGTTQLELLKSNKITEGSIKNITKSDGNFGSTFIDHHLYYQIWLFMEIV